MKVWVTKYALTQGIYVVDAVETDTPSVVRVFSDGERMGYYLHGEGKEWHRSAAAAVERANNLKRKRIASLKRSLAAMEAMEFSA